MEETAKPGVLGSLYASEAWDALGMSSWMVTVLRDTSVEGWHALESCERRVGPAAAFSASLSDLWDGPWCGACGERVYEALEMVQRRIIILLEDVLGMREMPVEAAWWNMTLRAQTFNGAARAYLQRLAGELEGGVRFGQEEVSGIFLTRSGDGVLERDALVEAVCRGGVWAFSDGLVAVGISNERLDAARAALRGFFYVQHPAEILLVDPEWGISSEWLARALSLCEGDVERLLGALEAVASLMMAEAGVGR